MNTTFNGRLRPKQKESTDWADLTRLPNEKIAFIYQRLSTHEQTKKSIYSIKAQEGLADLAKEDGYPSELIYVGKRDLGISGTKGREDRPELAYLIELIEAGKVESVYTIHISRLYRDQTLINALSLGELFKEHDVIIVTPQMKLNLRDKMHMRLYRMEVERAADELELMAHRLLGAKNIKARSGGYTGERVPPGFVINEQEKLANGQRNPDYHTYEIYEPHANVVKIIFQRLSHPSESPTTVARYCKQNGIVFPPFASEFDTPANRKTFARTKRDPTGSWIITTNRIRKIATNPAYIGWKIWAGEVVSKAIYPSVIDETTFWTVQKRFRQFNSPKKYDPLPLAGLLYCTNHSIERKMTYSNGSSAQMRLYRCYDPQTWENCVNVASTVLDDPISEAVLSQITLGEFADKVLRRLTDEYERVKEQAASYRREMRRLEVEIENLRGNMTKGVMSNEQLTWLDKQIEQRLERIRELADLEQQPVGQAVGRPVPDKDDIELVRELLTNLSKTWKDNPDRLKNALLRILLDKVTLQVNVKTIKAQLIWHTGVKQDILIHRPVPKQPWTKAELTLLRENYEAADKEDLMTMLPKRSWASIKQRGSAEGLSRNHHKPTKFRAFTPEEDELLKAYYADEIDQETLQNKTGRTMQSLMGRARRLGIKWQSRRVNWEWHNNSQEELSPMPKPVS
ncbi:MAG: recombinase family protein [Anaerolineae bacterium]|nr:recombinase family protein [Anaerolineae bacterium]